MNYHAFSGRVVAVCAFVLLAWVPLKSSCAENSLSPPPTRVDDTNAQETLRSYLQLQEQLHATRLAIEQNRQEAREAAEQTATALAARLKVIEEALAAQRTRELEALQGSNRIMFLVGATFAAVGFFAVLSMAYFQWRAVNHLAEISAGLPAVRGFSPAAALAALPAGDAPLVTVAPAEQSSLRLLGALERLEKRIYELEHTAQPTAKGSAHGDNGTSPEPVSAQGNGEPATGSNGASAPASAEPPGSDTDKSSRITVLLAKGQSMLNLDQAEAAVGCFDEVLALDPRHAEALVKKGTALERLQKLAEAIDCYDRAIAADGSLTIAYLHKGGLFNRMERFNEALECYEQALRTQEKRAA
jgi:tetratricopeptide (TPR) repeat protein